MPGSFCGGLWIAVYSYKGLWNKAFLWMRLWAYLDLSGGGPAASLVRLRPARGAPARPHRAFQRPRARPRARPTPRGPRPPAPDEPWMSRSGEDPAPRNVSRRRALGENTRTVRRRTITSKKSRTTQEGRRQEGGEGTGREGT